MHRRALRRKGSEEARSGTTLAAHASRSRGGSGSTHLGTAFAGPQVQALLAGVIGGGGQHHINLAWWQEGAHKLGPVGHGSGWAESLQERLNSGSLTRAEATKVIGRHDLR
jgi:hypothetical protein